MATCSKRTSGPGSSDDFWFTPFVQNLFNPSRCDGQRQSPKKVIVWWR
jgi:hypothetical protein